MDKVKKFFASVWAYLKTRGIGFYLLIPAVIFSFVIPFVYKAEYGNQPSYWDPVAMVLPLLACATYAMCFFKYTAKYAGAAMFAFNLGGLLTFVNTVYYDVADKLFKAGDISIAGIFNKMGDNFVFILIAYFINIIICIAASFFNQYRKVKEERELTPTEAQEVVS